MVWVACGQILILAIMIYALRKRLSISLFSPIYLFIFIYGIVGFGGFDTDKCGWVLWVDSAMGLHGPATATTCSMAFLGLGALIKDHQLLKGHS